MKQLRRVDPALFWFLVVVWMVIIGSGVAIIWIYA